jgi:hypothetical protein
MLRRRAGGLALLLVIGLAAPAYAGSEPPRRRGRPVPAAWHGVTTERVTQLDRLARRLRLHRVDPFVRVVFQPGERPQAYAVAVRRIRREAYVMGLPFDSTATADASVAAYRSRVRRYVERFGDRVDAWEIGNELNGAWVGTPRSIDAKVAAAFDVVEREHAAEHLRSAITLNYWPSSDCYADPWERTLPFARQLPRRVRRGVDVVLLSFYETACSPRARPTASQFARTLRRLGRIFPHARVGLGEVGAQRRSDGLSANPTLREKQRVAERYYGMHAALRRAVGSRFLGGYFWWYYHQDAVLARPGRSLLPTLDRLLSSYGR